MNKASFLSAISFHSRRIIPFVLTAMILTLTLAPFPHSGSRLEATAESSAILISMSDGLSALSPQGNRSMPAHLGERPLSFEMNQGQAHSPVKFISRGTRHTLFLSPNEVALALPDR